VVFVCSEGIAFTEGKSTDGGGPGGSDGGFAVCGQASRASLGAMSDEIFHSRLRVIKT